MKKVPELRFKEFSFPLDLEKFGSVVKSNIYGPRFNANDYDVNGNVKTIRGTDVYPNGEINYTQVPIAKIEENTIKTHRLEDGDLVMITTADCGLTGVFRKQDFDYICSAYAVKISLNEKGNPYYFKYFFQTTSAKNEISSYIRKATVANLPGSDILKIKVYLPSLSEQQKIASFLSAVDTKINKLTRTKELLEQYKKGAMQRIFSQELRFKADDGSEFPEWEEEKLGDIAKIYQPKTISQTDLTIEGYDVYGANGIIGKYYEYNHEFSQIAVTCRGNTCGTVNFTKPKAWITGNAMVVNLDNSVNMNKRFLYHQLSNTNLTYLITGSGQPQITGDIKNHYVAVPKIEEQVKIAHFLDAIDTKIDLLAKQLGKAKNFKKALLQQMFV